MRKIVSLLLVMFVAVAVLVAAQTPSSEDRVSGKVLRLNQEKSTLVVQLNTSKIERTVLYSPATKWTKAGSPIDRTEIKDNSSVVCVGRFNEKKELKATRCELQP
jgi:hypothetical protein